MSYRSYALGSLDPAYAGAVQHNRREGHNVVFFKGTAPPMGYTTSKPAGNLVTVPGYEGWKVAYSKASSFAGNVNDSIMAYDLTGETTTSGGGGVTLPDWITGGSSGSGGTDTGGFQFLPQAIEGLFASEESRQTTAPAIPGWLVGTGIGVAVLGLGFVFFRAMR